VKAVRRAVYIVLFVCVVLLLFSGIAPGVIIASFFQSIGPGGMLALVVFCTWVGCRFLWRYPSAPVIVEVEAER